MVQVSDKTPVHSDGTVNVDIWLQRVSRHYPQNAYENLLKHIDLAKKYGLDAPAQFSANAFESGCQMATILSELNADIDALCAALMFDIVSQGILSREKFLSQSSKAVVAITFGAINLNVGKALSGLKNDDLSQIDKLRKMLLTMVNDARIVLVKLAERVMVMRESKHLSDDQLKPLALGVSQIYAPLASRLGIGQIKWELEDRAFFALHREEYKHLTATLSERRLDRETYINNLIQYIKDMLHSIEIDADVQGRVKHIFSIYRKMQKKDLNFDELFDIRALRILVKDVRSCYESLGAIHDAFDPILSEFSDYIATPKPNGYRSIHTVVRGPQEKTVEIQIRTFSMHEESEMGVAAHWRYKEGVSHDAGYEARINWLRSLLDWQKELSDESKHMNQMQEKMMGERVYVFTPVGDVIDLPTGATPIDFAYHVHSDVGHRCRGAKVNGRLVQLNYSLSTGERVDITTGKESKPSRDWLREDLGFVKSHAAKAKIALWFRQQLREELNQKAETPPQKIRQKTQYVQETIETDFGVKRVIPKKSKDDLVIGGQDNLLFKMAGCCRPVIGDKVLGYITQGKGVSIHRVGCKSLDRLSQDSLDRLVNVEWAVNASTRYPVDLLVLAHDRNGLLRDITAQLSAADIGLRGIRSSKNQKNDSVAIHLTVEVSEQGEINKILQIVRNLPDVLSAER